MKKVIISLIIMSVLIVSVGIVVAGKNQQQKQDKEFSLPENAVKIAPGIFYLGKAMDKGKIVDGYAYIVKDKKKFVKPGTVCGNGVCEPGENVNKCPQDCGGETPTDPDTSSCYGFLSKGAKWKTVEPYRVDSQNTRGLDQTDVRNILSLSIDKWEDAASYNILGNEEYEYVDRNNIGNLNGENEVMFADIDSPGAIGVTIVWGIFGGRPSSRKLVEWDMVFNDVDFDWGVGDSSKMDFENIATHELGHAVGLGDLYTDLCSEQTMYGYSWEGDFEKRTLESGDIAGIKALY